MISEDWAVYAVSQWNKYLQLVVSTTLYIHTGICVSASQEFTCSLIYGTSWTSVGKLFIVICSRSLFPTTMTVIQVCDLPLIKSNKNNLYMLHVFHCCHCGLFPLTLKSASPNIFSSVSESLTTQRHNLLNCKHVSIMSITNGPERFTFTICVVFYHGSHPQVIVVLLLINMHIHVGSNALDHPG